MSWIGGKKALRKRIIEEFPDRREFKRYIEVFGGAGWVLFDSEKHANMEVYNDVNGNLVNLFRCIKYHPEAVQKELEYFLMSREQFFDVKDQIKARGLTDIQKAARFYILIKESFGSDLNSFGCRNKNMDNARSYLDLVAKRLNSVVIENLDFQQIIKTYDRKDALFYLDPPYFQTEKYYEAQFMSDDHVRLKEILDDVKGKFILSYNDCEYIRDLYKEYHIIEVDRQHNLVRGEVKPRYHELIIKNYSK